MPDHAWIQACELKATFEVSPGSQPTWNATGGELTAASRPQRMV